MGTRTTMNLDELATVRKQAEQTNARLKKRDGSLKGDMGKDAFLKLLVTELRHQDPTQPMQDREFISQMATFSSLEQMTNINTAIQSLYRSSRSAEAYGLLGKRVQGFDNVTGKLIDGTVSRLFYKDNQVRLVVGNRDLGIEDIQSVFPPEEVRKTVREKPVSGIDRPRMARREEIPPAGPDRITYKDEAGETAAVISVDNQVMKKDINNSIKKTPINNDINIEAAAGAYKKTGIPPVSK